MTNIKTRADVFRAATLCTLTAGLATALALPSAAAAADAATSSGNGDAASEEIVVTALRRDEKIQLAPAAITALSAQALQRMGATNFNDYYRAVPSLQITAATVSPGQSRVSIRGVYAAGESTVGLYYGDTPVTGPSGNTSDPGLQTPNINLFDVARVEVLRGPQGTLYGAGSVGGTIRIIYARPDATRFSGQVETQGSATAYGGEGGYLRGMLNIPLIKDQLALRVVAYGEHDAGWVDNVKLNAKDINTGEVYGGRAILAYKPSDDFDVTATYIDQKRAIDDNSSWYQSIGKYKTDAAIHVPFDERFQLTSETLNWKTPIGTLTETSSFYRWHFTREINSTANLYTSISTTTAASPNCERYNNISTPCSAAQLAAFKTYGLGLLPVSFHSPVAEHAQSHELRLASPGGERFDWTVGLFYEKRSDRLDSYVAGVDPVTGDLIDPLVANGYRIVQTNFSQFSQFAEVSLRPWPQLTLTAGTRHYSYDKEVLSQVFQNGYVIGSFVSPLTSVKAKEASWVSKVNLAYKFDDQIMAYVQWAQGFRPGGANNVPSLSESLIAYQPDSLSSYEAGLKTSWVGGRFTLNLSAFEIDWSGIQATLTILPAFRVVTNAGEARIRGLELEGTARPMHGLTLTSGLSYIPEAKLTSGQVGGAIVAGPQNGLAGDRLPYTAKFTASLSGDYEWPLAGAINGFVHLDANYHGSSANEFRPTYVNYEKLAAFTELNAKVGIEGDTWSANLFVNNLGGAIGQLTVQSAVVLAPYQSKRQLGSLTPRTVGITLSKRI